MNPQNGQAFYHRYDVLPVEELQGVLGMSPRELVYSLVQLALKFGYGTVQELVGDLEERDATFRYADTVLDGEPTVPNSSRFPTVAAVSMPDTTETLDPWAIDHWMTDTGDV
jgi:hypothetical protein